MSRQIQIRRGSAREHNNFTGAIGEITMDTDNKTLRVHDGETVGGTALAKQSEIPDLTNADYVVEWQAPNAENNYTWYRKYKSGWIEQGGKSFADISIANNDIAVNFPIQMKDNNYNCFISTMLTETSNNGALTFAIKAGSRQTNGFLVSHNAFSDWKPYGFEWFISGFYK